MRVAHVSNFWPNRFGLAHYTDALLHGIRANRPDKQYVIGEGNSAPHDDGVYRCIPAWRRGEDYVGGIVAALREVRADVAILQYVNDLFGDDARFPRLVREIEAAGVRTIVMPHSIYPPHRQTRFGTARDFDLAVADHASAFAVHTARMRRDLVERGVDPDRVCVIPHGTPAMPMLDAGESRDRLGLPRRGPLILFFGYLWTGKGAPTLIDAFARFARREPEAQLFIAGHTKKRRWGVYAAYLRARAVVRGVSGRMRLAGSYVPENLVPACYAAADLVALPYRQDYSSASGVVHQAAGMGKLMLCSRIAKFDEVGESISPELLVDPNDRDAWASAFERLLGDTGYAAEMRRRIRAFARETSWEAVGRLHVALQDAVTGAARPTASEPAGTGTSAGTRAGADARAPGAS